MYVYMYKYNLLSPYNVTCVYMISEHLFVPDGFVDTKKKGDEHLLEKCISHADGVTADNYRDWVPKPGEENEVPFQGRSPGDN